jgi:hypothetical protein
MSALGLTIVRACDPGAHLTKRIERDRRITAATPGRLFDLAAGEVGDLIDLYVLLHRLALRPDLAIVRGAPADRDHCHGVRRLARDDPATGDRATLVDVPRAWIALDLDGLDWPADLGCPTDPERLALIAGKDLPDEFRFASTVVQFTASHLVKPGIRARLWYALDRAITGPECRAWLHGYPVDPSCFTANQLIWTAEPEFAGERGDPVPDRLGYVRGMRELVEVPAIRLERSGSPVIATGKQRAGCRGGFPALLRAATRLKAASVGERHATLVREALRLRRQGVPPESIEALLQRAAAGMGKPANEISSVIAWAQVQVGEP